MEILPPGEEPSQERWRTGRAPGLLLCSSPSGQEGLQEHHSTGQGRLTLFLAISLFTLLEMLIETQKNILKFFLT